ncbi:MAG: RNA ligase partner protein [Desulfurococcales archaeon]|nr:RNA ligase partner protein [Desulfurococcales archaeon]MEB3758321.1 RNA ligase partner protein [Desulfurococcales archaeon]
MQVFVLDTTAVTEARLKSKFGTSDLESIVKRITELIRDSRLELGATFYMTPSTWNELRRFLLGNNVSLDTVNELSAWITVKAPDKLTVKLPASVFSEYISDMRKRVYKGLRVAEDMIKKTRRECVGANDDECYGEIIRSLRDKYREALRKGIIDSPEDFDTVILALELKGAVVSSDAGIKNMCEHLGIMVIDPEQFVEALKRMLSRARSLRRPGVSG